MINTFFRFMGKSGTSGSARSFQDTFANSTNIGSQVASTVSGGSLLTTKTLLSTCLTFDGINDYISVPSALNGVSGKLTTLMMWIAGTAYDTSGWILLGTNTTNSTYWQIDQNGDVYVQTAKITLDIKPKFTDGTWRHVAFTNDGTTVKFYLNGILTGTSTATSVALAAGAKNFAIGDWIGGLGGSFSFKGQMTDVRFWDSDIGGDQIFKIYATGVQPSIAGNSNWWKLNDGSGTTAVDSGSNPTNGILTNGPAWTSISQTVFSNRSQTTSTNLLLGRGATSVSNFKYTTKTKPGGSFGRLQFSADGSTWKNVSGDSAINQSGYFFNGIDGYITVGNIPALSFERTDTFSIGAWIRQKVGLPQSTIISKIAHLGTGWWLGCDGVAGAVRFIIRNAHLTNGIDVKTVGQFADGSLHHVFVTYDGSSTSSGIKIYVDGVSQQLVVAYSNLVSTTVNSTPINIGSYNDGSDLPSLADLAYGLIDDVRVYKGDILSPTTIYNLYALSIEPSETIDAWWKLDGNANDSSGNLYNGTAVGGAIPINTLQVVSEPPPFGYGVLEDVNTLNFFNTANQYVSIPDNDVFSFGNGVTDNPFSIEGWVCPNSVGSLTVFQKFDNSPNREYSLNLVGTGQLQLILYNTLGTIFIGRKTTLTLSPSKWYHVAATYDGSSASSGIKLYINGVQSDTTDVNSGVYVAMSNTSAVATISAISSAFSGNISNISIYSDVRTPSEVLTDYQNGFIDTANANLISYWPLNEGTGTTVIDSVGAHNGTMINAPTWINDIYRPIPSTPTQKTINISGLGFTSSFYYRIYMNRLNTDSENACISLDEITLNYVGTS